MQIIVRFHAIKSEMELSSEFWNKRSSTPPYRDIRTQIASVIFLVIYISYTNFCAISFTRNRSAYSKNSRKLLQRHLLGDVHQKLIEINIYLDVKYKIS